MTKYSVIKKIFYALLTVVAVIIFNYWLFRVLPGNPLAMVSRNPKATPEMIENIRVLYGLDKPPLEQFFIYLKNLFSGDLGMSFIYKVPVLSVIASRIVPTVVLLVIAEFISMVLGCLLGIISAWKHGTKLDVTTLGFSLFTYAMPTFWLGMILVGIFCVAFRVLPTGGMVSPGIPHFSTGEYLSDVATHMILPALTLAVVMLGDYALTMRNTMIDVLGEDYITTARAKGFGERYVLLRHAVPNAMLPMITIIAINLGMVVAGAVQIETIFNWPGLGRLMYEALNARDYPLLQGIFLLFTVSVVLANFISDILYTVFDPRVRI